MSYTDLAKEVISGKWGNGETRKKRLEAAGYDYNAVQSAVNAILSGKAPQAPSEEMTVKIDLNKVKKLTLEFEV